MWTGPSKAAAKEGGNERESGRGDRVREQEHAAYGMCWVLLGAELEGEKNGEKYRSREYNEKSKAGLGTADPLSRVLQGICVCVST